MRFTAHMFEQNNTGRTAVKRIFVATILTVLLVMGVGFFPTKAPLAKDTRTALADEAVPCSFATVAGRWGFTLTGTLLLPTGPVPAAAVLRGVAEINGNLRGTEARSVGGAYADETFTGSWTVNADCTGSGTVSFYEAAQLVRISAFTLVFDDNSKEVRIIQKSLTLPDGTELPVVVTTEGRKL